MNILVTGGAGFIGSHLCEKLLRDGHVVTVIDNMNSFYDPVIKQNNLIEVERVAETHKSDFAFYHVDIRHSDQVMDVLRERKIEAVIHLAAMAGVAPSLNNPQLYMDVNVTGTMSLLQCLRRCEIKKFIFASSSSIYGEKSGDQPFSETDSVDHPISPYAASKRAGELLCHVEHRLHDLSVAMLRFFTVYGSRQRPDLAIHKFAKLILAGQKLPVYGDGSAQRDFTFVKDIVDGACAALQFINESDKPRYEIFNMGGDRPVVLNHLIDELARALGSPADIQYLPARPGDVPVTRADITKSKKMLNFAAQVSLQEGLAEFATWILTGKAGQLGPRIAPVKNYIS